MKPMSIVMLGLSIAVAGSTLAAAQDSTSVPKVLQITREYIKPYKAGAAHDKTESAFVETFRRAKFPAYYVALNSLTGKSRALYLTGYDSFETWGKDNDLVNKNKVLADGIERAGLADGELLESVDTEVLTYNEESSYKPHPDMSNARYVEIYVYHVRPGHGADWNKLTKMVKGAHDKAGDSVHWAMFEVAYGGEGGTYVAFSGAKSLADVDTGFSEDKKFAAALGEDGMKEMDKLYGETVDASHSELFSVNPRQSYVPDSWIKADPDFWRPKPAAAPAAKPAAEEKKAKP
jgi:hypothetical protein